ncbi:alpha-hydroxy acid oxidase [Candidatus Poriferisocius sp.]|uniref:alpha-hydroxy acid oxidase n=1 Tax=Candidatus Poriferisocius sp. TaxID=3101276 RepID=UPI003B027B14
MIRTLRSVARFRRFEPKRAKRRLSRAASVVDLREMARRRLPAGVFDYIDGAAEDELTMERNAAAFDQWEFVPRVLRDVSALDTSVELLGRRHPLPLALSPTGFTRIVCPDGELAVARAAARKGIAYSLSTLSTCSIEEIREVSDGPLWFQLYFWRDRGLVAEWLQRAVDCDYEALLVAVDTPVFGRRERDVRRGFTLPPTLGPDTVLDGLRRPGWTWSLLRSDPITFANLTGVQGYDGSSALGLAEFAHNQFNQALSWDDLDWLRERWTGKLVLKGVQSVADAQVAAEQGVDGIILSNHGGRQLDGAPPILELVPQVADAVGGDLDIICDGGIRRGSHVAMALALGADAAMFGRPYLYALAAAGEPGVDHLIDQFTEDLHRTLALIGVPKASDLTPASVRQRQ